MAHAYTPGLRVAAQTNLRKSRRLPLTGNVVVEVGDFVSADDIVARTELPGDVTPLNIVNTLGIVAEDAPHCMTKEIGEKVEFNEVIAESSSFFGLFKSTAKAPVDGTLESVSDVTGQVIIRQEPVPVELRAYVDGKVVDILEKEGVVIETNCSFIQGIFGIGGESSGKIQVITENQNQPLEPSLLNESHAGKIVVGGNLITLDTIEKAKQLGVKGLVAGGINDTDLKEILGYDIGVAITGSEDIGLAIVVTEGFGEISMAERTFKLLKENEGRKASINGATQIRAGVIRPEVIIPRDAGEETQAEATSDVVAGGMSAGTHIRAIREPYFGQIGEVMELPAELVALPTEAKVRILKARFSDGEEVIIPRANVEIIEED